MKKYNTRQKYGMGWFNESHRHSLARQGIKTGQKINYSTHRQRRDALIGGGIGLLVAGPIGAVAGAGTGYVVGSEKKKRVDYYKISSISDKDKVELIRAKIANMLRNKGYSATTEIKGGSINLRDIRISDDRVKEQGHNIQQTSSTKSGERKTRALSWDDWVEVNNSVNNILDTLNVSANVKSLGGKFDIRDKTEGRRSESDWHDLAGENVGSMMSPISRIESISKPEKKDTSFGILQPSGKVTKQMSIDINKVKSDDPLAYSYGYFQAKSGQPMSKDKDLAKEYIRGYKDAKAGKKIGYSKEGDLNKRIDELVDVLQVKRDKKGYYKTVWGKKTDIGMRGTVKTILKIGCEEKSGKKIDMAKKEKSSTVVIRVNFNDEKSIKSAEKKKSMLENLGYKQVSTTHDSSFDKYKLIYTKR